MLARVRVQTTAAPAKLHIYVTRKKIFNSVQKQSNIFTQKYDNAGPQHPHYTFSVLNFNSQRNSANTNFQLHNINSTLEKKESTTQQFSPEHWNKNNLKYIAKYIECRQTKKSFSHETLILNAKNTDTTSTPINFVELITRTKRRTKMFITKTAKTTAMEKNVSLYGVSKNIPSLLLSK